MLEEYHISDVVNSALSFILWILFLCLVPHWRYIMIVCVYISTHNTNPVVKRCDNIHIFFCTAGSELFATLKVCVNLVECACMGMRGCVCMSKIESMLSTKSQSKFRLLIKSVFHYVITLQNICCSKQQSKPRFVKNGLRNEIYCTSKWQFMKLKSLKTVNQVKECRRVSTFHIRSPFNVYKLIFVFMRT